MATNAELARIFGGDADAIYLAPLGTTLPTTLDDAPGAGFEDVGWLHSDGITETATGSVEKARGHQGNGVVRTRMNEPGTTVAFVALESKALTRELRYDVKTASSTAGVRTEKRTPRQKVTAMAAVIDLYDADDETVKERYTIPRLEIAPTGDRVFVNSDISGFSFVGEIIGEYDVLSTDLEDES